MCNLEERLNRVWLVRGEQREFKDAVYSWSKKVLEIYEEYVNREEVQEELAI